jgi:hypothetical protein
LHIIISVSGSIGAPATWPSPRATLSDEDLLEDGNKATMSVLNDDKEDLQSKGRQDHREQCVSPYALPNAEHCHEVVDI